MKKFIPSLILILFIYSCEKEDVNSEIKQIKYGTSFGMCSGYCKNDILLQPGSITYNHAGWDNTVNPITKTEILSENEWDSYVSGVNITNTQILSDTEWNSYVSRLNIKNFFKLPETIGCPDCADGGAEWIEVELVSGEIHKVTFEYMQEPESLSDYLVDLRKQMGKEEE
jgi:hypothetical protein